MGPRKSGRTSLLRRWSRNDCFIDDAAPDGVSCFGTMGTGLPCFMMELPEDKGPEDGGEQSLLALMPSRYKVGNRAKGSRSGFVVVYDVTRRASFEEVVQFLSLISKVDAFHDCYDRPLDLPQAVLVLDNKADLRAERRVTVTDCKSLCSAFPNLLLHFADVSAKKGKGLYEAMDVLVELMEEAHTDHRAEACCAAIVCVLMAGRRRHFGLSKDVALLIARRLWSSREEACWGAAAGRLAKDRAKKQACAIQ